MSPAGPAVFIGITQCNAKLGNVSVDVDQCIATCGPGWSAYGKLEAYTAMTTWVIPLFLLVGNIHLPRFRLVNIKHTSWSDEKRERWANWVLSHTFILCHLLGNPIDFLLSHLHKLEQIRQIRKIAGADDGLASLAATWIDFNTYLTPHDAMRALLDLSGDLVATAASGLVRSRISSTRRAALAILAYAFAIFGALATGLAQESIPEHTPHTIALRALYYWLVAAVVLSAALGSYPDQTTATFHLKPIYEAQKKRLRPSKLGSGGCYAFWPVKQTRLSMTTLKIWTVAFVTVMGAWTFSFTMSWITPTRGIGCRSLMEIGFGAVWLFNFGLSNLVTNWTGRWHAWLHFLDILIAIPQILCLFLAFKGWFNSCKCWAAVWTLTPIHWFPSNIQASEVGLAGTYYGLIGGALGLQALISAWSLWHYRHELRVIYGRVDDADLA